MNKEIALDFLNKVIAGEYDYAYQAYVDLAGKHHNMYTPAGFDSLKTGMQAADAEMPNKHFEIKNVFGSGDLVAVHSHFIPKDGDPGMATVHMFRFENGKIVEMWDVAQQIPKELPNVDGAF